MPDVFRFDWDEANIGHLALHDVEPHEAEQVMFAEPVDLGYQFIDDEERWSVVGPTHAGRFLTIIVTLRNGRIRVVTAWDATRDEEAAYWSWRGQ